MSTKLVKGTPVVSLADGQHLGTVEHVYLDPERREIVGFTFRRGGLFAKTSHLVDVSDIRAIGPDAVTLADVAAVHSDLALEARRAELVDLDALLGRRVLTEGGALLGEVVGVRFGAESYRLSHVAVAPGPHQPGRLLPAEAIRQIGAELLVVAERAAAAPPRPLVAVA